MEDGNGIRILQQRRKAAGLGLKLRGVLRDRCLSDGIDTRSSLLLLFHGPTLMPDLSSPRGSPANVGSLPTWLVGSSIYLMNFGPIPFKMSVN